MSRLIIPRGKRAAYWRWHSEHVLTDERLDYFIRRDEWRHPIPKRLAENINPYLPVLIHDVTRELVCPHVERLALEWRSVIACVPLAPMDVDLLLSSLFLIERPIRNPLRTAYLFANAIVLAREHFSLAYDRHLRGTLVAPPDSTSKEIAAEEGNPSYEERKVELVARGLLFALEERECDQPVRIGSEYRKASDGRLDLKPAHEIHWADYLKWLKIAADREAIAILKAEQLATDAVPVEPGGTSSPLDALLVTERAKQAAGSLKDLRSRATPAQKRLVDALLEAIKVAADWPEAQVIAARSLGITPSTLRVQLHKIKIRGRAA